VILKQFKINLSLVIDLRWLGGNFCLCKSTQLHGVPSRERQKPQEYIQRIAVPQKVK